MKKEQAKQIQIYPAEVNTSIPLPWAENGISAGFPSPAQDYMELSIDLNQELIHNPASTFYGRVNGCSMQDLGIQDGDILVIDKSLTPRNNDVAVCFIDGEFTLKTIQIEKQAIYLLPANSDYQPIKITPDNDFMIWGIVTYSIKRHR